MKTSWIIILVLFLLWGCGEIIEIDITNKNVVLVAPTDSALVESSSLSLKWQSIDGAKSYKVQVASPNFDNPIKFWEDKIIEDTTLEVELDSGRFQWRVQALNNGYATKWATRNLWISPNANLSNQIFALTKPTNNTLSNSQDITFEWKKLPTAQRYLFQILSPTKFDTLITTNTNTFTKTFANTSQTYTWKVTALNSVSLKESATFGFSLDFTLPTTPNLVNPADNTIFTTYPITLSWSRTATDVDVDSLFVYNNSSQIVSGFPKAVTNTSFDITNAMGLTVGQYKWAVKSIDRAGNKSPLSIQRQFRIQ
ncbi:hypothetical protein AD998_21190 [bacterium 336/3]|nr:hypothetical protein AD998_21190 [bacterium 336/3]